MEIKAKRKRILWSDVRLIFCLLMHQVSSTNNDAYQHRSKSFSGRLCSPNSLSEQHSGEHDYNGRVGLKKRRTESRAEPVPIEAENLLAETCVILFQVSF